MIGRSMLYIAGVLICDMWPDHIKCRQGDFYNVEHGLEIFFSTERVITNLSNTKSGNMLRIVILYIFLNLTCNINQKVIMKHEPAAYSQMIYKS